MGEAMHLEGAGNTWEISIPSPQPCREPKTDVKKKKSKFQSFLSVIASKMNEYG